MDNNERQKSEPAHLSIDKSEASVIKEKLSCRTFVLVVKSVSSCDMQIGSWTHNKSKRTLTKIISYFLHGLSFWSDNELIIRQMY